MRSIVNVIFVGHCNCGMVTIRRTSRRRGLENVDRGSRIVDRSDIRAGRADWCTAVRPIVSEVRPKEVSNVAGFSHDLRLVTLHSVFEQREYKILLKCLG